MKKFNFLITLFIISISIFCATGTTLLAAEINEADQKVHKALKGRTKTFCNAILPAWFWQSGEGDLSAFRTLVADCYLGHARLTVLGIGDKSFIKNVGLSELPSALLARETGMSLDVYRPLAGRTIKDFIKDK